MSDANAQQQSYSPVAAAGTMEEDVKVAYWILVTEAHHGRVRAVEAENLVRSLYALLHARPEPFVPVLDLAEPVVVPAAHAMNVACLVMAAAERMDFSEEDTRALGLAALLKDIGQAAVPQQVMARQGPLTPEEQEQVRRHPTLGSRMLIETEESLELPAVVAYEHHIGFDGSGYPTLRYRRPTHFASRLVRLADVFSAMITARPHREAWSVDDTLAHIAERTGVEFDRELAPRFTALVRELEPHMVRITRPDQPLPWATESAG